MINIFLKIKKKKNIKISINEMNNMEKTLLENIDLKEENYALKEIIKSLKQVIKEDGEKIKSLEKTISLTELSWTLKRI